MKRAHLFSLTLCFVIRFALCAAHAQVTEQPASNVVESAQAIEARAHFTRGNELYAAGDVRGTLAEFERAYALRPSPLLRFHIGRVALELGEFARSYRAFAEFLATSESVSSEGSPVDAATEQRRQEAERRMAELEPRVAHLRIETNQPGARVSIDEQPVGEAPLPRAFVLDRGTVRVRASKPGFAPLAREVTLAGGDHVTLALELEALEPAPPPRAPLALAPPPRVVAAETERKVMTPGLWTGFAVAGVLGVAGTVTGVYALRQGKELEDRKFVGDSARKDYVSDSDRVRGFAIATDVLIGAAVISAQTSLVILLWRSHRMSSARPVNVKAAVHPRGLVLEGHF